MRRSLALFLVLFATFALVSLPQEAEARRMGFGKSMGRQYNTPQRQATAPAAAPRSTPAGAAAPAPGGASRWLGPVAGLLAGGLLASLFFGHGFEGFQVMDFLLIALLVFGAVMLFRAFRPKPALRTAAGPAFDGDYSQGVGSAAAKPAEQFNAPEWFNAEGFLKGARTHFIRLQAAWDKGDMKDIAEYTTPELFADLQAERLASGSESPYTEVAWLDAELLNLQQEGDRVVASVRFFGGIKEEQNGETEKFQEIWHVVHPWASAQGNWYVAGIQQITA
jgi:predicted lipid-binding transport protein (Tim44 family)